MDMIQKKENKYYITPLLLQSKILKNITKYPRQLNSFIN